MKYTVTNIEWDTDGENVDLPSLIEIDVPGTITESQEIDDYLSDEISNQTGFCHTGFATTPEIIFPQTTPL